MFGPEEVQYFMTCGACQWRSLWVCALLIENTLFKKPACLVSMLILCLQDGEIVYSDWVPTRDSESGKLIGTEVLQL